MKKKKYDLWGLSLGVGGLLIAGIAVVAAAIAVNSVVFLLLWNDFVVRHVANVARTDFLGAIGPAILISALCGKGYAGSRSSK